MDDTGANAPDPVTDRDGFARDPVDRAESFPIVGIGASAGGLEAFTGLIDHLPGTTGMAFVLIQHLDPVQPSRLREILSRHTTMPVLDATQGLALRPNHVYVIPPNTSMMVKEGILQL